MNISFRLHTADRLCRLSTGYLPVYIFLFISLGYLPLAGQHVLTGKITGADGNSLPGATVQWLGGSGAVADIDGLFSLQRTDADLQLVASFVGYLSDTITVESTQQYLDIILREAASLATVEVSARRRDSYTSLIETRHVEHVSSKELLKAPCCSLGESFESNASVDATYSDPLTGVREIQMLGLRGVYTQLLLEKRPTMTGLATPYGMDLIPGPWVESIQISKGAASVQPGAGSLTGQINTELIKPVTGKSFYLNLFGSTMGRAEANAYVNHKINERWSTGLLLHSSLQDNAHDGDRDGFQDMPNRKTMVGMYRLMYVGDKIESQFNVLAAGDRREAGQHHVHDHGQAVFDELYRINQATQNVEIFGKLAYKGFRQPYQSMGLIVSSAFRELDNTYGRSVHQGHQQTYYANLLYATLLGNSNHQFTTGASFQYDNIHEDLNVLSADRLERTAGLQAEYTYSYQRSQHGKRKIDNLTTITALRLDHHNLGGFQLVPRVNVKVGFSDRNALRLAVGRGWRSPNVLVENLSWLASSRQVVMEERPQLETAWNMGVSYTQEVMVNWRDMAIVAEVYRTAFQQQIVVDLEQDAGHLYFYQLDGASFSNSYLLQLSYELLDRLNVKLAHKWIDVQVSYRERGLRELPMTPRRRAMVAMDYTTRNEKWMVSGTYHWTGQQRLPDHHLIPAGVSIYQPQVAPAFGLINAQLTWRANSRFEAYTGVENLTDFVQTRPVIGAEDPFGSYFDAAQVYAPTFGRRYHLGIRYSW